MFKNHCHRPKVLPPIVHPTKCCTTNSYEEVIVPHIHPSHTTHVHHTNFKHQHYFPHTQSTENVETNQQFNYGQRPPYGQQRPPFGYGY